MTHRGHHDGVVNIPTMPIVYGYELENLIYASFGHRMWQTCH